MTDNKIIRDVVHGYIPIDKNDIKIIDTPHFQRLKRIRHTTINSVYPCANHTRFEHSLGVMHLANRVVDSLEGKSDFGLQLENGMERTVRYASLLHDVGHAPLSHLGELFYNKVELKQKVINLLNREQTTNTLTIEEIQGSPHELCSCAIAIDKLGSQLMELGVDLELLCRMITGTDYSSAGKDKENVVIDILNSAIDVDKLDYILRDSQISGARLVSIDTERLISAYEVGEKGLILSGKALSTIANLVHGRAAEYQWLVNHHVSVYTDCLFKRYKSHLIENYGITEFFAYDSISNQLIDDYDLISLMRANKKDEYLENIYNQLFYRRYYKTIWKTPLEFKEIIQDDDLQDVIIEKIGDYKKDLHKLEKEIVSKYSKMGLKEGDFFIGLAEFKAYDPLSYDSIYLRINSKVTKFHKIFVDNILQDKYTSQIPFFYYKDDGVKTKLLEILNNKL